VVDLSLDPRYAACYAEVPVTTGVAIPGPVSDGRHVAADGGERFLYCCIIAEVSASKMSANVTTCEQRHVRT
jgi:hypothetical protein